MDDYELKRTGLKEKTTTMVRSTNFGNVTTTKAKNSLATLMDNDADAIADHHNDDGVFGELDEPLYGRDSGQSTKPVASLSLFSARRTDTLVVFGMIALISGLLGVVYVLYKFMKEDQYRWKQMSAEIVKHRAQFDQLSNQMKQVVDEMKSTDHEWTEEIRKFIASKQAAQQSNPAPAIARSKSTTTAPASASAPIKPNVILEAGTSRLVPIIMSENDMDRVLADELQELRAGVGAGSNDRKQTQLDEGRISEETDTTDA